MQKIKIARGTKLTFEEDCNKYSENCRQRNLSEDTIGHYRQSYAQFYSIKIKDLDFDNNVVYMNVKRN